MQHLVYNVRYSVVPINSSLLTVTSYSSDTTTLIHNDKIFSPFHDVITKYDYIKNSFLIVWWWIPEWLATGRRLTRVSSDRIFHVKFLQGTPRNKMK